MAVTNQAFITINDDPFVYQENTINNDVSASFGIDSSGTGSWCLNLSTSAGAAPGVGFQPINVDPTTGVILFTPLGGGYVKVDGPLQVTGGITYTGNLTIEDELVDASGPSITFEKDRAGAVIVTGDALGQVYFKGFDGTDFVTGASITSTSSGTIAANRVAANLVFSTHPDSASGLTPTARLTIASTGAFTIAAPDSGVGLTISGGGLTVTGTTTLNTALTVPNGGTGATTLTGIVIGNGASAFTANAVTQYNVIVGGASNALTSVAPSATSGVALISQGAAADPVFGTVVVAGGGSGATTLTGILSGNGTSAFTASAVTQYGMVVAGVSNAVSSIAPSATSGVALISQGAAANPAYGTVVVAGGGTGAVTLGDHGVLVGRGTAAVEAITAGATGETLMGSTGANPSFTASPSFGGTITAATGATVTLGDVTLTNGNVVISTATKGVTLPGGLRVISGAKATVTGITAPIGSLFLATDGAGVNDRAYINIDGGTTWTAIVTVA